MKNLSPIIKPEELPGLIAQNKVLLIDARVGSNIKDVYLKQHLLGALHVDLERDLAERKPNAADGGRHPLPNIHTFVSFLGKVGISVRTHVVVYDDKNGSNAAARFWWMLKAVGHKKVQVLEGGLQAALAFGIPTGDGIEKIKRKKPYPAQEWLLPLADMNDVEAATQNKDFVVIDVRDAERYRGEKEPIDLIAGHIPKAINLPFSTNLDANGSFLPKKRLKNQYLPLFEKYSKDKIIVHCGSGVTACHTLLAMNYAGFDIPKLYIGSWSEWSRNNKPIGLGTE